MRSPRSLLGEPGRLVDTRDVLRRNLVVLLAGGSILGCATATVNLDRGPREYVWTDYDAILEKWTRDQTVTDFAKLDSYLSVTATYHSWDYRWAYAIRYARDHRLTMAERGEFMDKSFAELDASHVFYVATEAEFKKWADMTETDPAWVIRLVDDQGNETPPTEIVRIRKRTAAETTYYPYATPWRTGHYVHFPAKNAGGAPTISEKARWFGLQFSGPRGIETMRWELAAR